LGEEALNAAVRFLNPETMFLPPGYTQVVEATGPARIVHIAGQMGIDRDGRMPADFRAQAVQVFENLRDALAAVGGSFEHIVKLNNYLLDNAHLPVLREIRTKYLNGDAPPASTTLQVSGFARHGAFLEIEAVAVLPPAKRATASRARSRTSPPRPAPQKRR